MNSLHLHHMEALVTVAEHGSIPEAVRKTGRRKSELNAMIQLLEENTGLTLLSDSTESNAVTEAGWEIVKEAHHLFRLREEEGDSVARQPRPLYLVLAHCPTAEFPDAELFYDSLVRQFPLVELQFVEDDPENVIELVKAGVADFGLVRANCTEYQPLANLQLPASPLGCFCRADNPLAKLKTVTLADLVSQRQILPNSRYGCQQLADLAPYHTWPCSSLLAALRLADQGQGWLLTERSLAQDRVDCGKWVELPLAPEVFLENHDLVFLWNEETAEPRLKKAFLNMLT